MTIVVALIVMPLGAVTVNASDGRRGEVAFVVVVNASNPLREMRRDQVAAYFLKRRATWPDGKGVEPVDLPPDSRARIAFSRQVLRRSPSDVSAYWIQEIFAGRSEPPQIKNSDAAVISYVASTPGAIGYLQATPGGSGVHVLLVIP
jgi:ABC-type phosphate transport system substrate-binding protein